jgi:hypothetical protein
MNSIEKIRNLLVKGRREEAVQELVNAYPGNEDAIKISGRFFSAKRSYNSGLLSEEDKDIKMNLVINSIDEFLKDIKNSSLRILYVYTNPNNKGPQKFEEEKKVFLSALDGKNFIEFFEAPAVTKDDFFGMLTKYKPNLVHLSMHGDEENGFYFKDAFNREQPMSSEELQSHFDVAMRAGEVPLECVVLSCCSSSAHAEKLTKFIQVAVGMEGLVPGTVANKYALGFYKGLSDERNYKNCHVLAIHGLESDESCKMYKDIPKIFIN